MLGIRPAKVVMDTWPALLDWALVSVTMRAMPNERMPRASVSAVAGAMDGPSLVNEG
jgi:hypothetical protein